MTTQIVKIDITEKDGIIGGEFFISNARSEIIQEAFIEFCAKIGYTAQLFEHDGREIMPETHDGKVLLEEAPFVHVQCDGGDNA